MTKIAAAPQPTEPLDDTSVRRSPQRLSDELTGANLKIIGRVTVLERLFHSLSASTETVDLTEREAEFWDGLREITEGIADASADVKVAGDALYAMASERKAGAR